MHMQTPELVDLVLVDFDYLITKKKVGGRALDASLCFLLDQ
jgi:hypothetical protein